MENAGHRLVYLAISRRRPVYTTEIMSSSGGSMGNRSNFAGAGGTPGGLGEFFIGILLAALGCYLLFSRVQVHSSYWNFLGLGGAGRSFGISMLPLLFGIGTLFVNGKSILGWLLAVGGLLFILLGILMNMDIYFERTSLMNTLIMLGCIAAGFGLVVKSLRPHKAKRDNGENQ